MSFRAQIFTHISGSLRARARPGSFLKSFRLAIAGAITPRVPFTHGAAIRFQTIVGAFLSAVFWIFITFASFFALRFTVSVVAVLVVRTVARLTVADFIFEMRTWATALSV